MNQNKEKIFYIIPGWKESPERGPYQKLKKIAEEKGYKVILKNINWKRSIKDQLFDIEKKSTVFGFSLGAVIARLVAQKSECEKIILASMTPLKYFTNKKFTPDLVEICGKDFVYDIKSILKKKHLAKQGISLYGELEKEKADIIIPKTDHEINNSYLKAIKNII
ncbi:MAG: hypothetical protein QG630_38 [Patescibacteria group bacterium]|nr:hypothetical protein [Patescibacteria group bacterium]